MKVDPTCFRGLDGFFKNIVMRKFANQMVNSTNRTLGPGIAPDLKQSGDGPVQCMPENSMTRTQGNNISLKAECHSQSQ